MKLFAQLNENNVVLNTSVGEDDWQNEGWVEFTIENPAYIGGEFIDGYFYSIQPYPSWSRNNGVWQAPTPMPVEEGKFFVWDEPTLSWVELVPPTE
jgi:hypothetical protein